MADDGFVTLTELTDRYANFMKNPLPAGPGVCVTCRVPHDPAYTGCYNCSRQPSNLAAVVPITYSINLGQMHLALRSYKDGWAGDDSDALCNRFTGELAGVLRRFLDSHEACVAAAAGVAHFDLVTTVPSATTERDRDRWRLRWIVEQGCALTKPRYRRVLVPTEAAAGGKSYNATSSPPHRPGRGRHARFINRADPLHAGCRPEALGRPLGDDRPRRMDTESDIVLFPSSVKPLTGSTASRRLIRSRAGRRVHDRVGPEAGEQGLLDRHRQQS
jgi:hypothetical protein